MAVREVIANSNDLFILKLAASCPRCVYTSPGTGRADPRYQAYYRVRHYPAFD